MKHLLDLLLAQQPPVIRATITGLLAFIPAQQSDELDRVFDSLLADLAEGRDRVACDKLRALFSGLGVDLETYRDQHP